MQYNKHRQQTNKQTSCAQKYLEAIVFRSPQSLTVCACAS